MSLHRSSLSAPIQRVLPLPTAVRVTLVGLTLILSFAVSMTREDVPAALQLMLSDGPTLPMLLVLDRVSSGYSVQLPDSSFWLIALAIVAILALTWRKAPRSTR